MAGLNPVTGSWPITTPTAGQRRPVAPWPGSTDRSWTLSSETTAAAVRLAGCGGVAVRVVGEFADGGGLAQQRGTAGLTAAAARVVAA